VRCSSRSASCSSAPVEYQPTTSNLGKTFLSVPRDGATGDGRQRKPRSAPSLANSAHCSCFLARNAPSICGTLLPSTPSYLISKELAMSTVRALCEPSKQPSTRGGSPSACCALKLRRVMALSPAEVPKGQRGSKRP